MSETIASTEKTIATAIHIPSPSTHWRYDNAFQRNLGLISVVEQAKLRDCRVAIAGMGGVGGVHLATLARLGVGKFTIADPDTFDVSNFNRQYGARVSALGQNKAHTMAKLAREINPELDIQLMPTAIDEQNIDEFLSSADIFVDGLDFFAIDARRLVFKRAAKRGIWSITAGPAGFSTAWLTFDPQGMGFDQYFDIDDSTSRLDKIVALSIGLTPKLTHLPYTDFSNANPQTGVAPSAGLACQLAAGVVAAEVIKILLDRGSVKPAPAYAQFDPFRRKFKTGKLRFGNRGPAQRLKRKILRRRYKHLFNDADQ